MHAEASDPDPDTLRTVPKPSLLPIARVSVVDINMPFSSMVGFMLKWTLAAIPALVILAILGFFVTALLAGLADGLAGG